MAAAINIAVSALLVWVVSIRLVRVELLPTHGSLAWRWISHRWVSILRHHVNLRLMLVLHSTVLTILQVEL